MSICVIADMGRVFRDPKMMCCRSVYATNRKTTHEADGNNFRPTNSVSVLRGYSAESTVHLVKAKWEGAREEKELQEELHQPIRNWALLLRTMFSARNQHGAQCRLFMSPAS